MNRRISCRGLLFDCDGVLVDSDASVVAAWSGWATHYGLDPKETTALVHGRRSSDTVAELIDPEGRRVALELIDHLEINAAAEVHALPGARRILGSLPTGSAAIVTSATEGLARARLAAAGIPVPSALVSADAVEHGKPAPDGYLMGSTLLGLDPLDCVVFEDADSGVLAARRAGVGHVIGVGKRGAVLDVDCVVADLDAVTWSRGVLHVHTDSPTRN